MHYIVSILSYFRDSWVVTNIFWFGLFVIKLEDPTDLPDAIVAVVGKTFTFGISVEKEHVLYGSEIYTVGKIYRESQTVFSESANVESSESDQDLALTSGEELWLYSYFKWCAVF